MSLTFKLLSLAIRTAAKPIGNYIKRQAKEHEGFRKFAVSQAQRVHRIDMRMRLGILHDPEAQQRMHDREVKLAEEKKKKAETPTVRTAEEQKKFEEQQAKEARGEKKDEAQKRSSPKIKPLSETRAIELGANFFSEAFIFGVAVSLLVWDSWRSRSREKDRRDDVKERIEQLEAEVESIRSKIDPDLETLHDLSERIKEEKAKRSSYSWYNPAGWVGSKSDDSKAIEGSKNGGELKRDEHGHVTPLRKVNAVDAGEKLAADEVESKPAKEESSHPKGDLSARAVEEKPADRIDAVVAKTEKR